MEWYSKMMNFFKKNCIHPIPLGCEDNIKGRCHNPEQMIECAKQTGEALGTDNHNGAIKKMIESERDLAFFESNNGTFHTLEEFRILEAKKELCEKFLRTIELNEVIQ